MQDLKNQPIFSLSIAAKLLGIHPRTLMFYEKEQLISPARTETKRRLFSRVDLSLLQFIRYLINKKRVNTAGIRLIFGLLEKTRETNPKLKKEFFDDFREKELI